MKTILISTITAVICSMGYNIGYQSYVKHKRASIKAEIKKNGVTVSQGNTPEEKAAALKKMREDIKKLYDDLD